MISVEEFPKLEMPKTSLKVADPKTGETGYRVGLEVFHQLQCLNMLRLASYPDYYQKMASLNMNNKPDVVRVDLGMQAVFLLNHFTLLIINYCRR
jgi:hypothetical protein